MALGMIVTVVVSIIVLYLFITYFYESAVYLSGLNDGTKEVQISANKVNSSDGSISNFAYSIWFYVNDWNYKFGQTKIIFERMGPKGKVSPQISLDPFENNLAIKLSLFGGSNPLDNNLMSDNTSDTMKNSMSSPDETTSLHTCNISNIPIQRWVNLTISVYGRSLDVYIDGKLVRTCVLENTAFIDPKADIYLTPDGGFAGWTSNFQYFNDAVNPQQAWNIYKSGYGGSLMGLTDLLNKYVIRVTFLKDGHEEGSLEI